MEKRNVLITGGNKGLGDETARRLKECLYRHPRPAKGNGSGGGSHFAHEVSSISLVFHARSAIHIDAKWQCFIVGQKKNEACLRHMKHHSRGMKRSLAASYVFAVGKKMAERECDAHPCCFTSKNAYFPITNTLPALYGTPSAESRLFLFGELTGLFPSKWGKSGELF